MKTNTFKKFLISVIACLTVTTAWADVYVNETNFPDAGFREWLRGTPFGEDGVITTAEINSITNLEIFVIDADYTIKSVKGIEFFTSMTSLNVTYTVDAIDVTGCPQLKSLTVSLWGNSAMTSIDLSNNPVLEEFICAGSAITSLDLKNNLWLKKLHVGGCTELATMDLSKCKKLVEVDCDHTSLSSIDVSNCTDLTKLHCNDCPNLTSVNVTNCGTLIELYLWDTPLSSVDVSTCKKLADYKCDRTNMTRLDLTPNGGITVLACTGGKLQEVILPNSLALDIACQDNPQLTTLTIPGNRHLNTLNISNTQVSTVNLTSSENLIGLWCNNTPLSSIDLTHCPNIETLECTNTQLTSLDLSHCVILNYVALNDNQLTELKMPESCQLVTLKCQNNKISSLDLTGCRQMEWLECQNNQLTELIMPDPIVYPEDYTDYRYELGYVDLSVNKLQGSAIDAIISQLPKKEWETDLRAYDSTVPGEGNIFTQAQKDAAKAKNWIVRDLESNPSGIQLPKSETVNGAYYSLDGVRLSAIPTKKGVYIKDNQKIFVK